MKNLFGWERYLVEAILRRPGFHRAVEKVHSRIHRIQHGQPPEYARGGTNIDEPDKRRISDLLKLFWQELKTGHRPDDKMKK